MEEQGFNVPDGLAEKEHPHQPLHLSFLVDKENSEKIKRKRLNKIDQSNPQYRPGPLDERYR
jgi:hypothetical protein